MARRQRRTLTPADPVGPVLRALREEAGLSLEQVAAAMNTDKGRVSRVESGKAPLPSWDWIARFADACGADAEIVFKPRK